MKSKVKKLILFAPLFVVGAALFVVLGGGLVQWLWNWLVPPLLGLSHITFWQALGILVLCRILFGGFGMHGSQRSHSDRGLGDRIADRVAARVVERCDEMPPEERERFRQRMRERWGAAPSGGETKPL